MTAGQNDIDEKYIEIDRELVAANSVHCKQILLDTVSGYDNIVFDLENVSDCDTAGVQLLLSLKKSAGSKNRRVRLKAVPEVVLQTVAKYGLSLSDLFDIE